MGYGHHTQFIRDGVVGNISACHADARGSIPRHGVISYICFWLVVVVWLYGFVVLSRIIKN